MDISLLRWTPDRAMQWYRQQPWPCGFNYIPAYAISYTEMWMPGIFDLTAIDRELALAQQVGFNCLRVVLPFVVWEHDPTGFKQRLAKFLSICQARGLNVMPALFDDCAFGSEERLKDPWFGPQPALLEGWYANGWTPSPGHSMVRDSSTWPRLERYVSDLIASFGHDHRLWVWDLYNEPGNGGLGDASMPLLELVFHWARAQNSIQPLTVGWWRADDPLAAVGFAHSDIITFHCYGPPDDLQRRIDLLAEHRRPIINTEWLNRPGGSTVESCLPILARNNVGCMHWGLVNGRTQTHLTTTTRPGMAPPTAWQHDIFRSDHTPYDPAEIACFSSILASMR